MPELTDITEDKARLNAGIERAVTNEIKRRLPDAPLHEIAVYIVNNAPKQAKEQMGIALVNLLSFKQITNEREAQIVVKVITGFLHWDGELSHAIMVELSKRTTDYWRK